jgi:hypothetical protein
MEALALPLPLPLSPPPSAPPYEIRRFSSDDRIAVRGTTSIARGAARRGAARRAHADPTARDLQGGTPLDQERSDQRAGRDRVGSMGMEDELKLVDGAISLVIDVRV